jgi:hypothetical protein
MAIETLGAALQQINRLFAGEGVTGFSDSELLERFVAARDGPAFEALVARHGPLVLSVCRGILRDTSDAEDAFQATFSGRVVGPDKEPVSGAKLYASVAHGFLREPFPAAVLATTGPDGRFELSVLRAKSGDDHALVAAMAPNCGVNWAEVSAERRTDDVTIQLVRDQPMIGEIIDLEGKPVAGAGRSPPTGQSIRIAASELTGKGDSAQAGCYRTTRSACRQNKGSCDQAMRPARARRKTSETCG